MSLLPAGALLVLALGGVDTADFAPVRTFRAFDRRAAPGLPQSTVIALHQDERGVLWIGTLDGIASYDGTSVRSLRGVENAPGTGPVYGFSRRGAGGFLACGTKGVWESDGRAFALLATTRVITSVAETRDGTLWAVAQDGEVVRLGSGRKGSWEAVSLGSSSRGLVVRAAADGRVFLADTSRVFEAEGSLLKPVTGVSPEPLSALLVSRAGTAWVGTTAGAVYSWEEEKGGWTRAAISGWDGGFIRVLAEDLRGRIWAGGNNGRVAWGRPGEAFTRWGPDNGLRGTAIISILADREGTVWFGYNGNGMQQWVGEAWSHRTRWRTEDPANNTLPVFGLTNTRDGGFLAAAFGHGLWRWDGRAMRTYGPEAGLTEDVRLAVEPEPGVIWAAARFGLFESRQGRPFRKVFAIPSGFVNGLYRSPAGEWYASTSTAGVFVRTADGWRPEDAVNDVLPDRHVRAMIWVRGGERWLATLRGVTVLDASGRIDAVASSSRVPMDSVNALLETRTGEVWVGGFGGIWVWSRQGPLRTFRRADGVPGDTVYSLAEAEDGTVWIGGASGVARYRDGRWLGFDATSGLIDDECNLHGLLPRPGGRLLVGTMASLAFFDPSVEPLPRPPLAVHLQSPPAGPDGAVHVPEGSRGIRINWSAPWLAPQAIEYRTRVQGLSDAWSPPTGKNELDLPYLSAGAHVVEVQARFAGRGQNGWTDPLRVRVVTRPFWYETTLARAGALAAFGLAMFGIVRLRTLQLARRAARLDEEVARRTAELTETNRQLHEAQDALREQALRDPLTGLYNRRAADERLEELFASMKRRPSRLAVLLFDLDFLKVTNDRDGHEAGDALLRRVAAAARSCARDEDVLARYGGDEFLAVLPGADQSAAASFAERLRAALEGPPLASFSGGIASMASDQQASVAALLRAADLALYEAKRAGRSRVVCAPVPGVESGPAAG